MVVVTTALRPKRVTAAARVQLICFIPTAAAVPRIVQAKSFLIPEGSTC